MSDRTETILVFMIVLSLLALIAVLGIQDITQSSIHIQKRKIQKSNKQSLNFFNYDIDYQESHQINKCIDSNCDNQRNIIQPNENQHKSPKNKQTSTLKYHSKLTLFVHDSIEMRWYGDHKGDGLIVNRDVKAGEILIVEYPLLKLEDTTTPAQPVSMLYKIEKKVQMLKANDQEFADVWNGLAINAEILSFYIHGEDPVNHHKAYDIVKFITNHFGGINWNKPLGIYSLLSKINFGLPQNIAVIFGDKSDNDVCIIIATRDIERGKELVSDFFFDWFDFQTDKAQDPDYLMHLQRRKSIGTTFGFNQDDEKWMKLWKKLGSKKLSTTSKYKLATKYLYPNGIIGRSKNEETEIVNGTYNRLAEQIKDIISSRLLFDLIVGDADREAPSWTGKQFIDKTKQWRYQ